jgi:hypothetical protein
MGSGPGRGCRDAIPAAYQVVKGNARIVVMVVGVDGCSCYCRVPNAPAKKMSGSPTGDTWRLLTCPTTIQ